MCNQICWTTHLIVQVPLAPSVSDSKRCAYTSLARLWGNTFTATSQPVYIHIATLTEYCSCNVYTGLLEPIRHSNIAPMGLSNEAGLSVDCGDLECIQAELKENITQALERYWKNADKHRAEAPELNIGDQAYVKLK